MASARLPGRPPNPCVISLGDAKRAEPESLLRRPTALFRLVVRARVMMLTADGVANCAIAERLGICQDTARKWRRRYREQGIDGLADAPRPGQATCVPPPPSHGAQLPPKGARTLPLVWSAACVYKNDVVNAPEQIICALPRQRIRLAATREYSVFGLML